MTDEKKKYNHMENVFQYLNKNYVTVDEKLSKRNNVILKHITDAIIKKMCEQDVLFKKIYRTLYYGGSYYDGLKISKPEEYDLDLLMTLPSYAGLDLTISDVPGFVHLQLTDMERFRKQPEYAASYKGFENTLCDDQLYLSTKKVLQWMESVIMKSLKEFPESGSQFVFEVDGSVYYVKMAKTGPAFTLKINGAGTSDVCMDIDLVPCFVFANDKWPSGNFRTNPFKPTKPEFFIVPKSPKDNPANVNTETCWRLSFQEQERQYMRGLKTLKPSLKLLKRLRDQLDHKCISSYFIKTVFLWQIDECKDNSLWNEPLSTVYIMMLKKYASYIENKNIPYFWNKSNNLVANISNITLDNLGNALKRIVNEIDRNVGDSYIGAKSLLSSADFEKLKTEVPVNKKVLKSASSSVQLESCSTSKISSCSSSSVIESQSSSSISEIDGPSMPLNYTNEISLRNTLSELNTKVSHIQNDQQRLLKLVESLHEKFEAVSNLNIKVNHIHNDQQRLLKLMESMDEKLYGISKNDLIHENMHLSYKQ